MERPLFDIKRCREKVAELMLLPDDWDSYGSRSIQQAAVNQTNKLLDVFSELEMPQPFIVPVPGGGLQFEFQKDKRELEIEILPDGSLEYFLLTEGEETEDGAVLSTPGIALHQLALWLRDGCNSHQPK